MGCRGNSVTCRGFDEDQELYFLSGVGDYDVFPVVKGQNVVIFSDIYLFHPRFINIFSSVVINNLGDSVACYGTKILVGIVKLR